MTICTSESATASMFVISLSSHEFCVSFVRVRESERGSQCSVVCMCVCVCVCVCVIEGDMVTQPRLCANAYRWGKFVAIAKNSQHTSPIY